MNHQILICDDNDSDVYILLASLKTAGLLFDSIRARDGEETLGFLTSSARFDLVILDLRLPCLSGLDVLQNLEERNLIPACPIVVLTSRVGREREILSRFPTTTIWEKPLNLDGYTEVANSIAKLL